MNLYYGHTATNLKTLKEIINNIKNSNFIFAEFLAQPSPHRNQRQRPTSCSNSCPVN